MKQQIFRLNITPQTHVRATQGDRILFCIPKEKRNYNSQKRVERLERYSDYKASLLALAKEKGFILPPKNYLKCSKSMTPREKRYHKRKRLSRFAKWWLVGPDGVPLSEYLQWSHNRELVSILLGRLEPIKAKQFKRRKKQRKNPYPKTTK